MALDLYQRLGLKRGASEAEIKKAYRSLAKQLHPDRNKDNPNAAKRFGEITHAYDLLSDKDKRARYDRGEIDEDGNPKMPFGSGFGGYSPGAGGPQPGAGGPGFESFNFGGAARVAAETAPEWHFRIAVLVDFAAIVARSFVLVRQQVIGVRHLGEALGRVRIVLVAVGVELLGEASIGLFDFLVARTALNAETLVEVECH